MSSLTSSGEQLPVGEDLTVSTGTAGRNENQATLSIVGKVIDLPTIAPRKDPFSKYCDDPALRKRHSSVSSNRLNNSPAWDYFHVYDELLRPDRKGKAQCNLCGTLISFKKGQTTGLRNHLKALHCHEVPASVVCSDGQGIGKRSSDGSIEEAFKKQKASGTMFFANPTEKRSYQLRMVAKWIAQDLRPTSIVSSDSFRQMIDAFDPSYKTKPFSEFAINDKLIELEDEIRQKAVSQCQAQKIALTIDHWSSRAKQNYTGMTAHFINEEWELHSLGLGCFLHDGESTGQGVYDDFLSKLYKNCGFKEIDVVAVVSDTTGNMNKFGRVIENLHQVPHIYCTDHVLQLSAKLAYKDENFCDSESPEPLDLDCMKRARSLVEAFSRSNVKAKELKDMQATLPELYRGKRLDVIGDVVTRWWSTYMMVDRLLVLRPALECMHVAGRLEPSLRLDENDWDLLKLVKSALAPFRSAQMLLEGQNYVTASLVPLTITLLQKKLKEVADAEPTTGSQNAAMAVKALATKMLLDFETRWGPRDFEIFTGQVRRGHLQRQIGIHPTIMIATALDPRFKDLNFLPDAAKSRVHRHLLDLLEKHVPPASTSGQHQAEVVQENNTASNADSLGENEQFLKELLALNSTHGGDQAQNCNDGSPAATARTSHARSVAQAELNAFILIKPIDFNKNPLQWWKIHKGSFPIMAVVARMLLAIPATSAPSERIFSTASHVLSATRNRTSPDKAGRLIFVHENNKLIE